MRLAGFAVEVDPKSHASMVSLAHVVDQALGDGLPWSIHQVVLEDPTDQHFLITIADPLRWEPGQCNQAARKLKKELGEAEVQCLFDDRYWVRDVSAASHRWVHDFLEVEAAWKLANSKGRGIKVAHPDTRYTEHS